jgi:putative flippase GtrA
MIKALTKHMLVRYFISGSIAAGTNICILSFLYYVIGLYYLAASVVAFLVSFFVSLSLHKFWTFRDNSLTQMPVQMSKYLFSNVFGLLMNTFLLYFFVDYLHIYVFLAQVFASLAVACVTFFISRDYIFQNGQYKVANKISNAI